MAAYIAANYQNQSAMSLLCYRFGKMAAWLRTQSFAVFHIVFDDACFVFTPFV